MEQVNGANQVYLDKGAEFLNKLLADEFLLYAKTRNAHWNIEGPDFYEKHKFFEQQYKELDEIIDDIAERIRTLNHYALATLKEFLQVTHLSETASSSNTSSTFIMSLLADHESIIFHIRANIKNLANEVHHSGTTDFVTSLLEKHEKMAWMLRAHLNN